MTQLVKTPEQEFHEERLSCLGGTDIAALLGLHPYKTDFDVFLEKTGQLPPFTPNDSMQMGTGLEPYIAAKYEKQTGIPLLKGGFVRHPTISFFGGHLDYLAATQEHGVEIKLVGARQKHRWSDPGPDQRVPEEYYCQCQWYMFLTGMVRWHLVAQKEFKKDLDIYVIEQDCDLHIRMVDTAVPWWERHVLGQQPPEAKGALATRYIAKQHPTERTQAIIPADSTMLEVFSEAQSVEEELREAKERYETLKNRIKQAIGDDLGIEGHGFKAVWRTVKDSEEIVVDWRKWVKDRFGYVPNEEELAPYSQTVVVRAGGRRLDIKFDK